MGNLGATELLLIALLVLLFFGSKKIPELAQGLGKGIREFKKATRAIDIDNEEELHKSNSKPSDNPTRG